MNETMPFDPALDLVLKRQTALPAELVWKAWTTPELLVHWFTPKPWRTAECDMQLWPGGRFLTVMEGPDGERFSGEGCILEVVENRRLVWTSALLPGYRPKPDQESDPGFSFTAIIEMEATEAGTNYSATLRHGDPNAKRRHEEMGFESGWGAAFDQLVTLMS